MKVDLRTQLRFYDSYYQHNKNWRSEIERDFLQKIIFIGVHCRRTDYEKHTKWVSGATLVDHHFFDTAFDIYRRKYNDNEHKVIFLAVSDDIKWIKVCILSCSEKLQN